MAKRDTKGRFSKPAGGVVLPPAATKARPTGAKVVAVQPAETTSAGWWQRWWQGGSDATVRAADLATVRASVMDELQARNLRHEAAAPFARPLLPEHAPRGGRDWLFTGFVAACVAAIVLLLVVGGRDSHGPAQALDDMVAAVKNKDSAAFAQVVDVDAVATDAVGQVFGTPVLDAKTLPASLRAVAQAGGDVEAKVKPGLAALLADDVLRAVEQGRVGGDGLLAALWREAGAGRLVFGTPRVVHGNEREATAEVLVRREDSEQVMEVLTLRLAKVGDAWRVVGIPVVAPVLARLNNVTRQVAEAEAVMAAVEPSVEPAAGTAPVRVAKVDKSLEPMGDSMTVRVTLANDTAATVSHSVVWITFADARGIPLRIVELEDGVPLAAGARRERVLPVPVDRADKRQRWVAELPLSALTVQTRVVAAR